MSSEKNIESKDINKSYNNRESITKRRKKLITIGKCSHFYLYVLGTGISKIFSLLILGTNNSKLENGFGFFGFCPVLSGYSFMQSFYTYIGYIIFGVIFFFKLFKKKQYTGGTKGNNLIYNNIGNSLKNIWSKIKLGLNCFVFALHSEIKKYLYGSGFQFFNFWTFDFVFMLYFMKKYFVIDSFRHHKCAIIFLISSVSIVLLIASFLPNSLFGDNSGNSYDKIQSKFGSYFYCFLIILFFVFLSFIFSLTRTFSKIFMEIKFVSPYKLLIFIGVSGLVISLITSIVCYNIGDNNNLIDYYSALKKNLDEGSKYKFYGEIFLVTPLYAFTSFMEMNFEILIIYYLNPFYVLMTNNLYYGISEFLSFMLNLSSDGLVITHFILAELSEIFAAFSYMVYLEIIELNFCGLNYNLKKHIILKGEDEFNRINTYKITRTVKEEEGDDNDDDEENKNGNKGYKDAKGLIKSLTKKRYENI